MEFKVGQEYKIINVNEMWDNCIYDNTEKEMEIGTFKNGNIVELKLDRISELCMYNGIGYSQSINTFGNFDEIFEIMQDTSDEVYFVQKHPLLKFEQYGDLIDLQFLGLDRVFECSYGVAYTPSIYVDDDILYYGKGDIFRVKLGFSMRLPKGKTAKVYMRSGTRKNFNVRLTNHVGCIDNNYNGTNDEWLAEFEAIDDGQMKLGDRILQFEIIDAQPKWKFTKVDKLEDENRGGFGNSGVK
jgi:dUTP pyrophosphatase